MSYPKTTYAAAIIMFFCLQAPNVDAQQKEKISPKSPSKTAPAETGGKKKSAPPASVKAASTAIDLTTLQLPKDSELNTRAATRIDGRVKGEIKGLTQSILSQLNKAGWKPLAEPNSQMITEEYSQAMIEKDGFVLSLSVTPSGMPGELSLQLLNLGNVDPRNLPHSSDAKVLYVGRSSAMYTSSKSFDVVTAETRKLLKSDGWIEFSMPFSQSASIPNQAIFESKQNGVAINVFISVAPGDAGKTSIQYSTRMLQQELPVPSNAESVEFDDTRPYLRFKSRESLKTVVDYFQKAFPETGFTEKGSSNITGDNAVVVYRTKNKDVAFAELKSLENGSIDVVVRTLTAASIAAAEKTRTEKTTKPTTVSNDMYLPVVAIPAEAADVVILSTEAIRFRMTKSVADSTTELKALFKKERWNEDPKFSISTPFTSVLELSNGKSSMTVLIAPGDTDSTSEVTLTGTGVAKAK